jgi:hypothetical protein
VSDSGGPEDPEVEKLRQQLAAAERAADLRAQLVEARKEVAEVSKLLGENNSVTRWGSATTAEDFLAKRALIVLTVFLGIFLISPFL